MTPRPGDLAELGKKYALLAALRRSRANGGAVPERAFFKALANRFPGVLNELDTLPLEEIDARARALEEAAAGGALAPWMAWIHSYHALLRAALQAKGMTGRAHSVSQARAEVIAAEIARDTEVVVDADFVQAVVRPARGRILPVVYARLSDEFGAPGELIADTLFPRRRARRSPPPAV